jgi:hypothetical protein
MTVRGGSVQASGNGDKAYGVSANNSRGESGNGSLVIEEGVASFIAQGPAGAINADTSVKNAVVGLGYSDVAGTEGKTSIAANADSKDLSGYRRALFPATAASATTSPAGKSLPYTGKPQELVTEGAVSGGTMLYSLDGKAYAAELPTATDPGEYTVYYKVAGDASHVDSQTQTVTSTIAEKAYPAPTMSNSKGSAFTSQADEVAYTVNQEVPKWVTSVRTWVDLESVLQYTVIRESVNKGRDNRDDYDGGKYNARCRDYAAEIPLDLPSRKCRRVDRDNSGRTLADRVIVHDLRVADPSLLFNDLPLDNRKHCVPASEGKHADLRKRQKQFQI